MKPFNFLISIMLALTCSLSCAQPKEALPPDFLAFWGQFHKAWTDKNFAKIQELSELPVTMRGVVDGIKPQKLTAKDFSSRFADVMQEPSDEIKEGKLVTTTVYEKIKSIEKPKATLADGTHMRVEDLQFEKINGSWKLTGLYSDSVQ